MNTFRPALAIGITAALALLGGCSGMMHNRAGDQGMPGMQDMHRQMAEARTPQERQALMAEHMKVVREGMGMMQGGGTDPAWRQQMQSQCTDMMRPGGPAPAK